MLRDNKTRKSGIVKVGDLVELSVYGRNLKNYYYGRESDVALIMGVGLYGLDFAIQWCSDGHRELYCHKRDIRHVKKTNKSR